MRLVQGRCERLRGHHGISTFSVAMAVTGFVILLSILLNSGLSMGRLFGKKSVETIQTGLVASVGNMEVLGSVTARATLTTLHGEDVDRLGPADGSTNTFPWPIARWYPNRRQFTWMGLF